MRNGQERGGPPSIVEVARAAGVSTATAGRVLGGYGQASAASRTKVEEAAQRLGYRPNGLARSLIHGSTETVGVIVTDIGNSFFASAVRAVTDVVRAAGYEILLANTDSDPAAEQRALTVMWEKRVDGLIIAPQGPGTAERLRTMAEAGLPTVLLDRPLAALPQVDQVTINNTACARSAVNHLTRLGHRRIAVVSEAARELDRLRDKPVRDGDDERPSAARLVGYLAALRRAGVEPDPALVVHSPYDRDAAERAVRRLLRKNPDVTALFCTDNVLSSGAVAALQSSGRSCPEEISLVGFDDQDWTTLVHPRLTVVRQPRRELGTAAGRRLLERMAERARSRAGTTATGHDDGSADGPVAARDAGHRHPATDRPAGERIVLRGRLIIRDSTGPAPRSAEPVGTAAEAAAGAAARPAREAARPAREPAGPAREADGPARGSAEPGRGSSGPASETARPAREADGPADEPAGAAHGSSGRARETAGSARKAAGPARGSAEPGREPARPAPDAAAPGRGLAGPGACRRGAGSPVEEESA
ncbi:substrate-binding domain-containing protein [Streptomyces albus]|uniref:substrate-binding domain-containing protein n=1 Tax=Streptomyces sp. PHES57 TaxID=2872626 RepID=UPI001CEDA50B|nr:substrate-binding domain-containing protein [Streptomyces sp. PHES57]